MNGRGRAALLLLAAAHAACAVPHAMERADPAGSRCPPAGRGIDPATGRRGGAAETGNEPAAGATAASGLRWYRAGQERDRALAARWCATVGEPVIDLRPDPSLSSWMRDGGVEVVTWNTYLGGGDILGFLDDQLGLRCSSDGPVAGPEARPFVFLVQEAFRRSTDLPTVERGSAVPWMMGPPGVGPTVPDVVEIAERCGLALVYVPSARNGADTGPRPAEDKGNAVLSTLPLRDPLAIDLPLEAGRKVAVAATITAPGGESVRVVSAHLDVASSFVRTLFTGNQTRARQTAGLVEGLALAESDGPDVDATVVGADMNTWAVDETALQLMELAFPASPVRDRFGTRGSYPTDHLHFRHAPGVRLVLTEYRRLEQAYASDHLARAAILRYSDDGSAAR